MTKTYSQVSTELSNAITAFVPDSSAADVVCQALIAAHRDFTEIALRTSSESEYSDAKNMASSLEYLILDISANKFSTRVLDQLSEIV